MFRSLTAPVVALAILATAAPGARAALIPPDQVQWNYNWFPTQPDLFADGKAGDMNARINFSNENPNTARAGLTGTYIVATNLTVYSTAGLGSLDKMTGSNGVWTMNLSLGVAANGFPPYTTSTPLTFQGRLYTNPSEGFGAENAKVENQFITMMQTVTLGGYKFKVTPYQFSGPGPANQQNKGSLRYLVEVSLANNPTPQDTPEPSTLVLCGLGTAFAGFAARRRKKAAEPVAA
ncbi:MAG: PEP-CTERM sorting domain-containing protein [Gemmataceae bacterium]|nr:PEP-CTERM sorting domain-containing protein [Gemmataceae bacterium]